MKGIFLVVLLLSLLSLARAQKCEIFECKGWFTLMEKDVCMKTSPDSDSKHIVRKCKNGKECEAAEWFSTAKATDTAWCYEEGSDPIVNQTLPGDICRKDVECYGEQGKVYCDGVCRTTVQIGDFCATQDPDHPGDWTCPVGSYCDIKERKCAEQLNEGDVCDSPSQCTTGFNCIKLKDDADFKCTKYWSLENGDIFYINHAKVRDQILPLASVCKSHWGFNRYGKDDYECRRAPHNDKADDLRQLRRPDGPWSECRFTAFVDFNDPTAEVQRISSAKCGFNKDNAAYCDKHMGDKWFQRQLKRLQETNFSSIKCHTSSSLTNCRAFNEVVSKDLYLQFYRELVSTPEGLFIPDSTGYALYANNDKCIAETITSSYWQGEKPHYNTDTDSVISELIES